MRDVVESVVQGVGESRAAEYHRIPGVKVWVGCGQVGVLGDGVGTEGSWGCVRQLGTAGTGARVEALEDIRHFQASEDGARVVKD